MLVLSTELLVDVVGVELDDEEDELSEDMLAVIVSVVLPNDTVCVDVLLVGGTYPVGITETVPPP